MENEAKNYNNGEATATNKSKHSTTPDLGSFGYHGDVVDRIATI